MPLTRSSGKEFPSSSSRQTIPVVEYDTDESGVVENDSISLNENHRGENEYFLDSEDEFDKNDSRRKRMTPQSCKRINQVRNINTALQDLAEDFENDSLYLRRSTRRRKFVYESLNDQQSFVTYSQESEEDENHNVSSRHNKPSPRKSSEKYLEIVEESLRPGLRRRVRLVPESEIRNKSTCKQNDSGSEQQEREYNLRRNRSEVQRYDPGAIENKKNNPAMKRSFASSKHREEAYYRRKGKKPLRPAKRRFSDLSDSSSDDEYMYGRRKAKSMLRARSECLPLNMTVDEIRDVSRARGKVGSKLADIEPMDFDKTVRFDSIGGMDSYIQSLKEMVLFPLMYPEVFEKFSITPPRGVIFHGPPGTGKTLVARALANECSFGNQKVAFFMRKGADCLSKWVGESERQLRLLFDQAYIMRPSIIFFDEIDGIAPVRSSKQDQIHSSIVSTLLALMDGMDNRGQVVVIGATNRIDAIDPALRRPGRFDREFLFSLPNKQARRTILSIHTRKWAPSLPNQLIAQVADHCVGYCGADLKSLCTEAALGALRRRYPQIYERSEKLLIDVNSVCVTSTDFAQAMLHITPASERALGTHARMLSTTLEPLLSDSVQQIKVALRSLFPQIVFVSDEPSPKVASASCLVNSSGQDQESFASVWRNLHCKNTSRSVLFISAPASFENLLHVHLGPTILYELERYPLYSLDMCSLFGGDSSTEEICIRIFRDIKKTTPCVVYIPRIHSLWMMFSQNLRTIFASLVNDLPSDLMVLFVCMLENCNSIDLDDWKQADEEIRSLFEQSTHLSLSPPTVETRRKFLTGLDQVFSLRLQTFRSQNVPTEKVEILPVAPIAEMSRLSKEEEDAFREREEIALRELRIYLRSVTENLLLEKSLRVFSKPVTELEAPDYFNIVKRPIDLETIMNKVDDHMYTTVRSYLDDIDLIVSNAMLYNPVDDSDRVVHKARALQDLAYAMLARLDKDIVKSCEVIAEERLRMGRPIVTPCKVKQPSSTPATRSSMRIRGVSPSAMESELFCSPRRASTESQNLPETSAIDDESKEDPVSVKRGLFTDTPYSTAFPNIQLSHDLSDELLKKRKMEPFSFQESKTDETFLYSTSSIASPVRSEIQQEQVLKISPTLETALQTRFREFIHVAVERTASSPLGKIEILYNRCADLITNSPEHLWKDSPEGIFEKLHMELDKIQLANSLCERENLQG